MGTSENETYISNNLIRPIDAVLIIFVTVFFSTVGGAISLVTLGQGPTLVIGTLIFLIVPLGYMLFKRINIRNYVGINFNPKFIIAGIAFGVALLFLNIVVSGLLTSIFGVSEAVEASNYLIKSLSASYPGLIMVVLALILAGVCEEFALRGLLQNSLTRKYSFIPAVLITSAVFGFLHFDPQLVYIISAFISGLVLGYIYHRYNYVTVAISHSFMNVMVLVIILNV